MFITKKLLVLSALVLALGGLLLASSGVDAQTVQAQEEVVLYNSRYIYIGDSDTPAIFDTATGVYRVWDKYPDKVVRSYNFEEHKDVQVDIISYQ